MNKLKMTLVFLLIVLFLMPSTCVAANDAWIKPNFEIRGATTSENGGLTPTPYIPTGYAPLDVFFFDRSSASSPIVRWSWDFGDGTLSHKKNPIHTYTSPGAYQPELTIQCANGMSASKLLEDSIYAHDYKDGFSL